MIPYEDFGGDGALAHFAHANGYPPQAYKPLLDLLSKNFRILAMRQRPLWPQSRPDTLTDWRPFAADLACFLDQHYLYGIVGIGHSFGAISTLRLALQQPDRFSALVLIDPVLFPPRMILFWNLLYRSGLGWRFHPLVRGALRRRRTFESKAAMFANYRAKVVFSRMNDAALQAYVNSLACEQPDGSISLCYPAEWEARIYVTSMLADMEIWRNLSTLKPSVLFVRGAETDTFWESTAQKVKQLLPAAQIVSVENTSHLLPLEKPEAVYQAIMGFIPG
ncbi:MAG: alpha/beta hydrolase [Anaerolineales bacterium]|nr:alpha/beta hydrolase [Anaerolineales bacterium]